MVRCMAGNLVIPMDQCYSMGQLHHPSSLTFIRDSPVSDHGTFRLKEAKHVRRFFSDVDQCVLNTVLGDKESQRPVVVS